MLYYIYTPKKRSNKPKVFRVKENNKTKSLDETKNPRSGVALSDDMKHDETITRMNLNLKKMFVKQCHEPSDGLYN